MLAEFEWGAGLGTIGGSPWLAGELADQGGNSNHGLAVGYLSAVYCL